jgi:hypothetical protein
VPEPASRTSSERLLTRILLGLVIIILAWFVLDFVLGWLFQLLRIAVLLALLGIVAWIVLVGPPGSDDR